MFKLKNFFISILLVVTTFATHKYFDQKTNNIKNSNDIVLDTFLKKQEKRKNGYAKSDKPDQFLEVMRSLKIGENNEKYPDGYKLKETIKAQHILQKSNSRILKTNPITSEPWIERGPNNVPGRTRTIIVDKLDKTGNTWITGSVSGGIWKSQDKGESWYSLTEDLPNLSISHIAQSESNPSILYACTGEGYGNLDGVKGDGIFKSIDGGNSWFSLENTIDNQDFQVVNRIIVDPENENNLTVCTSANPNGLSYRSSIFISNDGGETWTRTYRLNNGNFNFAIHQVIADPNDFNIQFAAAKNIGIFKSTDRGQSWNEVEGIFTNGRVEISISEVDSRYMYASIAGDGAGSGDGNLYISRDNGDNWTFLQAEENYQRYLGGQGWYDNTISSHPFDTLSFYVGGVDLWKINITEGTNTINFQRVSDAYGDNDLNSSIIFENGRVIEGFHPDHHYLLPVVTSDSTFYIINTNDGGVYYSNTGKNPGENDGDWTFAGTGYNTTQFYGIDKKTGANQYVGGSQDNGTWISSVNPTSQSQYQKFLGGDGFEAVWNSADGNKILGSIYNNIIYRSNDGGNTYFRSNDGLLDTGDDAPFITKIANSKENPDVVFAVGASGVWKSDDFGENWSLTEINNQGWILSSFMDIKVSNADPNVVWAGFYFGDGGIQVSVNNGDQFNGVRANNEQDITGFISGIATDPIDKQTAYVLFSYPNHPKILKTTDYGFNWVELSGFGESDSSATGFPNVAVYDLLVFPYNDDYLWAGTEIGIFESLDAGKSWHPLEGEIPAVCIWDMKYSDNQVYVGTHGRGIWSVDIPENPQPKITDQFSNVNGYEITFEIQTDADSIVVVNRNKGHIESFNRSFSEGENLISINNDSLQGNSEIQLISYKNNLQYKSKIFKTSRVQFNEAMDEYYNDFKDFSTVADFHNEGISFRSSVSGFSFAGLHSQHPFEEASPKYSYLKTPIIIKEDNPNFYYKDVTLMSREDGYVSVEAKRGSEDWVSISGLYNSSLNEQWQLYSERGSNGAETLEVKHQIDLSQYYSTGDTILVRFKINSDEEASNWGWAITYLNIQSLEEGNVTSNESALFSAINVYPNPVSNRTTYVEITSDLSKDAAFSIVDLNGREVKRIDDVKIFSGKNKIPLDLGGLNKGVYVLIINTDESQNTFKVIIE